MAKRRRSGLGIAVPTSTAGYPKTMPDGRLALIGYRNNKEFVVGYGRKINCTRVRPGERGAWISNERCSYQFRIHGQLYACRGRGDGIAASCRIMKTAGRR